MEIIGKIIRNSKEKILLILSEQQGEFLSKDSDFKLIENFEELMTIINDIKVDNIFKFIFSFKSTIHNILYEEEETINIQNFILKKELSEYYYLALLIEDNEEMLNYVYNFDFIKEVHNLFKIINSKKGNSFQTIIISKILLEIINNFCGLDDYNEDLNGKDIDIIKNEIDETIKNNLKVVEELNINVNIQNIKLDVLYCEILASLIKSDRFNDYNYIYSLLDELQIDKISIGKEFLDFNKNIFSEKFIQNYIIKTVEDLLEEKKINFYYILLKFILKDQIFIFNNSFLNETRSNIIKILKSKQLQYENLGKGLKERLKFILVMFSSSEYYFQDSEKEEINKLKTVLNYYQYYLFESKKDDIVKIKEDIKNKNIESNYIKEYENAFVANESYPIIKEIYPSQNNEGIDLEKHLNDSLQKWKGVLKSIKEHKIKKLKNKDLYLKIMTSKNYETNLLKLFTKEQIDYFVKRLNEISNQEKKNKVKEEDKDKIDTLDAPVPMIAQKEYSNDNNSIKNNKFTDTPNSDINLIVSDASTKASSQSTPKEEYFEKIKKPQSININIGDDFSNLASILLEQCSIILYLKKIDEKTYLTIDNVTIGPNNIKVPIDKFKNFLSSSNNFYDDNNILKNGKLFSNFIQEIEERIINEFLCDYPLKLKIELIKKSDNENEDIYNMDALYTFYDPVENMPFQYKDGNVLVNCTESYNQGFNYMLEDINQKKYRLYKNYKQKDNNVKKEKDVKKIQDANKIEVPDIFKKANEIEILKLIKIIENKNNTIGLIKELNNGFFAYVKGDNTLVLVDKNFNPFIDINKFPDKIVNICDMFPAPEVKQTEIQNEQKDSKDKNDKNNDTKLEIALCGNRELYLTSVNLSNMESEIKNFGVPKIICFNSIEFRKNNYIIAGKNGVGYFIDLFTSNQPKESPLFSRVTFFNSIKITDNMLVFVSNSIFPGGEDLLVFYNFKKKKPYNNDIRNYSFTMSPNGLQVFPILDQENKNKVLLCACKKYSQFQKNGILIVNTQLGDNREVDKPFFDTGNFEVYCFCPILNVVEPIIKNKKENNNIKLEETNYFLVGGFDTRIREGKICLYKINYGDKAYNTTIEYIQDIIIKDKSNIDCFNGPINCLVQSKTTGNILVSCYNGNIYLLTPPNINYYLKEDRILL